MLEEIIAAVVFIMRIVRLGKRIPNDKQEKFSSTLFAMLQDKFKNHWYADEPSWGQAYRSIRINPHDLVDPVLEKAARHCGLDYNDLTLPKELTIWVDPNEVSCRFGENQGDICKFFTRKADGTIDNHTNNVNIESFIWEQEMNFALNIHIVNSYEKHLKYKTQPCNNGRAVNNLYQKLLADI